MFDNSNNPDAPYHVQTRLENLRENAYHIKGLCTPHTHIFPNHNGTPISVFYLDDYIGLVDAVFSGTATIEDNLNHKYIEKDPVAPQLCRVRYGKCSIFINVKIPNSGTNYR